MFGQRKSAKVEIRQNVKGTFKLVEWIGKGSFGNIWRGQNKLNGDKVTIKVMKKIKMTKKDEMALQQEIEIMNTVDHPNIIRMIAALEETEHYFLVFEYCKGGDLIDSINTEYRVSERDLQ